MLTLQNFILTNIRLRYLTRKEITSRYPQSPGFVHLHCVVMRSSLTLRTWGGCFLGQRALAGFRCHMTPLESNHTKAEPQKPVSSQHRKRPLGNARKHKPCLRIFGNWKWNHWPEFIDCGLDFAIQKIPRLSKGSPPH